MPELTEMEYKIEQAVIATATGPLEIDEFSQVFSDVAAMRRIGDSLERLARTQGAETSVPINKHAPEVPVWVDRELAQQFSDGSTVIDFDPATFDFGDKVERFRAECREVLE